MRLFEVIDQELLTLFKEEYTTPKDLSKRDKGGAICLEFLEWCKARGIEDVQRVRGTFVADRPSMTKQDFSKFELQQMREDDFDVNSASDRALYARQHDMLDELKQIPHYWCIVEGKVIDVTGQEQLLDTKLAVNLSADRYIEQHRHSV
jgi:hypothetical protein